MSSKNEREKRREERIRAEEEAAAGARRRNLIKIGGAAAGAAVLIVAILIVVSLGQGGGGDTDLDNVDGVETELAGLQQSGTVLGDPDAAVTIVEFGDLQCPVCREFSENVTPDLISGPVTRGDANYEFRQWAILGEESETAGKAALAAAKQGRYWNFIELFYDNQGIEHSGYVTDEFLESIAEGAGVEDLARWNSDRRNPALAKRLAAVDREATRLGLTGTPSVVVEGPGGVEQPLSLDLSGIEEAIQAVR